MTAPEKSSQLKVTIPELFELLTGYRIVEVRSFMSSVFVAKHMMRSFSPSQSLHRKSRMSDDQVSTNALPSMLMNMVSDKTF